MALPIIPGHEVAVVINVTSAPPLSQAERDEGRQRASADLSREASEEGVRLQAQLAQQQAARRGA